MALNQNQQSEIKGLLDINSNDFYWDKLRPAFIEYIKQYRTDTELNKTIDKCINTIDSAIDVCMFDVIAEQLRVLSVVVEDKNYMNRHMKTATDEEKEAITDMMSKVNDFIVIMQNEPIPKEKEVKIKDRLDYIEDKDNYFGGKNSDFSTRNMETLNKTENNKEELNKDKRFKGTMVGTGVTVI